MTAVVKYKTTSKTTLIEATGTVTNVLNLGSGTGATVGAMTAKSPETDAEAGYLTIVVNGTTYEIPFYAIA